MKIIPLKNMFSSVIYIYINKLWSTDSENLQYVSHDHSQIIWIKLNTCYNISYSNVFIFCEREKKKKNEEKNNEHNQMWCEQNSVCVSFVHAMTLFFTLLVTVYYFKNLVTSSWYVSVYSLASV